MTVEFPQFPGPWFVEQAPHIGSQTADRIKLKYWRQTHYGHPPAWLSVGCTALNSHLFIVTASSSMFPIIGREISNCVVLKFGWASYYGHFWVGYLWPRSIKFPSFHGFWSAVLLLHIDRQTSDHIELKIGRLTQYKPPLTRVICSHVPMNSSHFLTSVTFTTPWQIKHWSVVNSNWMDKINTGLTRAD